MKNESIFKKDEFDLNNNENKIASSRSRPKSKYSIPQSKSGTTYEDDFESASKETTVRKSNIESIKET